MLAHSAFGADEGKVIRCGSTGNVAFAVGDFTAGCVILGRGYTQLLDLGRLYLKDEQGRAVMAGRMKMNEITVVHNNSGYYKVKIAPNSSSLTIRQKEFDATGNDVEQDGELQAFVGQYAERVTVTIENDQPDPSTIATVEFDADYSPNSRIR